MFCYMFCYMFYYTLSVISYTKPVNIFPIDFYYPNRFNILSKSPFPPYIFFIASSSSEQSGDTIFTIFSIGGIAVESV